MHRKKFNCGCDYGYFCNIIVYNYLAFLTNLNVTSVITNKSSVFYTRLPILNITLKCAVYCTQHQRHDTHTTQQQRFNVCVCSRVPKLHGWVTKQNCIFVLRSFSKIWKTSGLTAPKMAWGNCRRPVLQPSDDANEFLYRQATGLGNK